MLDFGREEGGGGRVRGGREQFRWDSVKGQSLRDRECYLGQSVKIGMQGRHGKYSRHDWWQGQHHDADAVAEDRRRVKQMEDDAQAELLGRKPRQPSGNQDDRAIEHNRHHEEPIRRRTADGDRREGYAAERRRHDYDRQYNDERYDHGSRGAEGDWRSAAPWHKDRQRNAPGHSSNRRPEPYSSRRDSTPQGTERRIILASEAPVRRRFYTPSVERMMDSTTRSSR